MHISEEAPCGLHSSQQQQQQKQQAPSDSDDAATDEPTVIATLPEGDVLSEAEAARLLRKIDWHVLPMLFLIYVVAFLDRSNVSNALTMSMPKELGLTGQQPNVSLAVFFVPYIVFEIPSNLLMKRLSPHVWLSLCVLGFGVTELCQGFIQNYGGLLATRFFLGFFEAGIFPGSFYLISFWYKRDEAQKRFTVYFCSVILASAFGGLLASAIANMDGLQGRSNWRWIFILEGVLTVLVAIISYFSVSDFPQQARWLSEREKQAVLRKTRAQDAHSEGKVTRRDLCDFFSDGKNYLGAIMYFSVVVPVYAFAYFTPTIVKGLGYNVLQTQLRSVPPFAAAFGFCLVLAYLSDRSDRRLPYVLISGAVLVTGLAILITTHANFSLQYAGICLVCMGALSAGPSVICWYLMNLTGHKQRSIGSAWMISFGNTGGILAPFAFLPQHAPYYRLGYSLCMAVTVLGTVATACYAVLVARERRRISKAGGADKVHVSSL
ncbi:Major facilitator superfamily domain, general substrate transporter [Metarhizium album ARSEF 1941]|uniref:Major facilitator superfamily domain, general substrate transporter n=1 Tax=Metarhizium album (strain ARSEF 1941) TaxID=1081103 RepID=A0A0B2WNL5_METAS|nr:Major facilitator superfamily domain, general substrate transporter [Metarhizium album ARSEF 1941]KHN95573.1 Major facilitator superfamily domain, general substrate transporter [Metarhizium album ARSEF 1941]